MVTCLEREGEGDFAQKLVEGAFASTPLQTEVVAALQTIFPEGRYFSISIVASNEAFLSAFSQFRTGNSWPTLCIQKHSESLLGLVSSEQSAKTVSSRVGGKTGLTDVDFAVSRFSCDAVIAAPISSPDGKEIGVLTLGFKTDLPPEDQQSRVDCISALVCAIGQKMQPFLSAQSEHLISNVLPYYLGRDHQPSGAGRQAERVPESDRVPGSARIPGSERIPEAERIPERSSGRISGRVSEGEEISEAAGVSKAGLEVLPGSKSGLSCQEEENNPGGSGRRFDPDSGGPQIPVGGEVSRGLGEEAVERQGSGALPENLECIGTSTSHTCPGCAHRKDANSRRVLMHPFWLTFSTTSAEAKFAMWFSAWMSKVDFGGHVLLLGIGIMCAVKAVSELSAGFPWAYLQVLAMIMTLLAARLSLILLCPSWYVRNREALLMVLPVLFPLIPAVQNGSLVVSTAQWPDHRLESVFWLARAINVTLFLCTAWWTMLRFRVSFPVHVFGAFVSIRKLSLACSAPVFQSISAGTCVPWALALLLSGVLVPHALTWTVERKTRQLWRRRHLD